MKSLSSDGKDLNSSSEEYRGIAKELDKQYALAQDMGVSKDARALYQQLYKHALSSFTAAGFEVIHSAKTNKHTIRCKMDSHVDEQTKPTNLFASNTGEHLADKSIDDVMICPKCGSDDCYSSSTDEIEFNYNNTGHYFADCCCKNCAYNFRLYTRFKYELTDVHT